MTAACAHSGLTRHLLPLLLFFISILRHAQSSEPETLLSFKNSFINGDKLTTWNTSTTPCNRNRANWDGVLCFNGTVYGIKLEGRGLQGTVNTEALTALSSLLMISLQNNSLEGMMPDFRKSRRLRSIFLTGNNLSGEIPAEAFGGMRFLRKIYLADNDFVGPVPLSLTELPKLKELMLENNEFEGDIPEFESESLTTVNFANNHLQGLVPEGLRKFPASQFSGNTELCGPPLGKCKKRKTSMATTIMIVLAVVAALAAIVMALMILHQLGPSSGQPPQASTYQTTSSSDLNRVEQGRGSRVAATTAPKKLDPSLRLTFLREDNDKFDLPDLLKASAEILGGGVFGSSYKAVLNRERVMVVKRFRHMNHVPKDEFVKHMKRLGKLDHPNLLPFIAFYYRKEEKLLVTNYIENISLAVHLHGSQNKKNQSLDWPTRLKIVKGIAKGLQHLYDELPSLIAPHGHLKSSNVLLNRSFEPILTDYGLVPITNQEHARDLMVAYKSPEYKRHGRITKKTDVWSLGVLILEIMTGRFPANTFNQGNGGDVDLENFVDSVMREELTTELVDKEMKEFDNWNADEIMRLLKIGLSCCEPESDKRLGIKEVVEKIEEVRENNDDDNNNDNNNDDHEKPQN